MIFWNLYHFSGKWQHVAPVGTDCPGQATVRHRFKSVTLHPNGKVRRRWRSPEFERHSPNPSLTDFYVHLNIARYVFSRSKHFEQPRKRLALAGGGRNPKLDPAVFRYTVRFNEEEHNRFLSMFEKSGVYAKSVFLKAHFFGQPFKVLKVDKTLVDYYTKLSDFHAQFRAVGTNYNQVVKELRLHFSEEKAMALLYKLEQHTIELVKLSRQIVELSREMQEKWSQKSV